MPYFRIHAHAAVFALAASAPALAQSSPSGFGFVYNIGDVTPGSIFDITDADIPGVLTLGSIVGTEQPASDGLFITPTFLNGNTLGDNSQLNLFDGGVIRPNFFVGIANTVGTNVEANIFGGEIEGEFRTLGDAVINIEGGVFAGGVNNPITNTRFSVSDDSVANISGGDFGSEVRVSNDAVANISGGLLQDTRTTTRGIVNMTGGLVLEHRGSGQGVLNLMDGEIIEIELLSSSIANITGGFVDDIDAGSSSVVNISGGVVRDSLVARSGSTVNVSGGEFDNELVAEGSSTVNISGDADLDAVFVSDFSTVNLTGSTALEVIANGSASVNILEGYEPSSFALVVAEQSTAVNIFGGEQLDLLSMRGESTLNLFGTSLFVDGISVDSLVLDEAVTIADRNVTLSGQLADGSAFSYSVGSDPTSTIQLVGNASLTFTLVPAPGASLLLAACAPIALRRRR